jgi:hypothetical protein
VGRGALRPLASLSARSALGPHRISHAGIPAGTSGHDRYGQTAGHRTCRPRTSAAGAGAEAASNPTSSAAFALVMAQLPPAGYSWMLADAHTMVQPE